MSDPFAEYDQLLRELEERAAANRARRVDRPVTVAEALSAGERLRRFVARFAWRAGLLALALLLPFYVLVGSSVFLYRQYALATWPALLIGVGLTITLLLGYVAYLGRRLGWRAVPSRRIVQVVVALVCAYCLYALLYVSGLNVKEAQLRSHFRSLHPLLRVATSTVILVDRDLVITDMGRQPADYARMGLPLYENSLHFRQDDGYAHALDLRTLGRSRWRNHLIQGYFWALGFRTLRHVGTADHLHVSLPPP